MNAADVIETDIATIVILWKNRATVTDRIPTPPYVSEASKLWNGGHTAKEICSRLGLNVGKGHSAHTEWLNRLRLAYPKLFPMRRDQQKGAK